MVYDSVRERVVLFGGTDDQTGMNDTWEWDGTNWRERTPAVSPPPRWAHAMAYDSTRKRVVLFGGVFGPDRGAPFHTVFGDTWEWDGETWIERTPGKSPPNRLGHGMAYDSARQRTVLFGGIHQEVSRLDTWEWDGDQWIQRTPFVDFFGLHYAPLAYDSDRRLSIVFGGRYESDIATTLYYDDTMEWDGETWEFDNPQVRPSKRSEHGLAYDSGRRELVLFGGDSGLDETWVFRSPRETICDDADDNDNGLVDEHCADADGDGYCAAGMIVQGSPTVCPRGGGDCDDADGAINPGALDLPGDTIDQNCDGTAPCNPAVAWRNHGQFVSCVSKECDRLVSQGLVEAATCDRIVRDAAHSLAGR